MILPDWTQSLLPVFAEFFAYLIVSRPTEQLLENVSMDFIFRSGLSGMTKWNKSRCHLSPEWDRTNVIYYNVTRSLSDLFIYIGQTLQLLNFLNVSVLVTHLFTASRLNTALRFHTFWQASFYNSCKETWRNNMRVVWRYKYYWGVPTGYYDKSLVSHLVYLCTCNGLKHSPHLVLYWRGQHST